MGPLREQLRAGTRAPHDRVDAAFARFDLRDREGYAAFLLAHASVLPGLERAAEIGGAGAVLPDWPERRRAGALAADLERLGAGAGAVGGRPVLSLPGEGATLGVLYVLEGSRLGARLLAAEARRSADPLVRQATAYLGHGEGRRFWPSFLERLERYAGETGAVLAGARGAFAAFESAALRQEPLGRSLKVAT